MENIDRNKTILVIVTGFLVLSYIFKASVLVTIATVLAVLCLVFPPVARFVEWIWFKIAHALGWFNSRVLLGIVFFVILFPIALLSRMTKRNSLKLRRADDTLFTVRDYHYKKEDFENMW